jgi:O-acetyl-ADP-ribose deacetylase (regulator of RNase III)
MICTYHGDITKLHIECIVNASNELGFGCNIKNHCIDSAIHYAAGPKLLEECKKLNGVPTGTAKITHAYNLPSKYIIHTTGPRKDLYEDYRILAECYEQCLKLATKHHITEIAFCCISTGIFGFNKRNAATIAIDTVRSWIASNKHSLKKIIFVTYTDEDKELYSTLLSIKN